MPSFDIVSEVDKQEIDNALNQARKELATRFDLKDAKTEIIPEPDKIILIADDGAHLKALREIVIGKLSRRGVDLRNVEQEEPAISSVGHARQELKIKQGLEGNKAKEIIQAIKSQAFKVQSQLQDRQIRVTGKKKDDLQAVIQFVRSRDFGVADKLQKFQRLNSVSSFRDCNRRYRCAWHTIRSCFHQDRGHKPKNRRPVASFLQETRAQSKHRAPGLPFPVG